MRPVVRRPLVVVGGVLTFVVASCGGSTSHPSASSTSSVSATSPGPAPPEVSPSGDIPDSQAYVAFRPASGGFTVNVPEGWARTESGAVATFTDKLNSVRIERMATPTAPTVAVAQSTEVPAIKVATANMTLGKVTTVGRTAGTAVLITYEADAPPDPVTAKVVRDDVERYEFWRNGVAVVLTLSGPHGADNVDPWHKITTSFGWQ